ncbi:norbelladine synthase-like [Mercurialis annua]|uniref:norbelladine synthase-like n=1 Tax=Mercurialis annua TaxID=3986 RepID=UPI00215EF87D|nr:norbelladine synthase-like [Mercurialis annua]
MRGQQSVETPIGVSASIAWDAYRGLQLGRLVSELLGDVVGKVELLEGDGGVGTIMKLTFPPGTPGIGYMKEVFTMMDDDKRVKETEMIEGDFKDMGFDVYHIRLEIIEKDDESSVIRSTIEYEIDDSKPELASLVSTKPLELMAETLGKHLIQKKSTK